MSTFFAKNTVFALILGVFFMMSMGGVFSSEMMMDDGSMTHNCPYMGVAALCNMSPIEHLSQWQQMFWTTSQELATTALLVLLALSLVWFFVKDLFVPGLSLVPIGSRYRERERIVDPLRLAFARGLIHSKVF